MKMFRITSSEIKKTLTRPSLYIMGIFLVVLLIFTAIIYNPNQNFDTRKSYSALNLYGNSAEEIISNFNSEKHTYTDSKVSDLSSVLNFYENNSIDFSKIYAGLDDQNSEFAKLNSAIISYTTIESEDFNTYNTAKRNLESVYENFKLELNKVFNANYPVVQISTKVKTNIDSNLNLFDSHIAQEIVSVAGHKALINTISSFGTIYELNDAFKQVKVIEVDKSIIDNLRTLYSDINVKLDNADKLIKTSETLEQAQDNCAKYVSIKTMGERLIGNKLYLELIKGKTDNQVNNLYALKTNPFINDNQEIFFKNYITEQIAIDEYLYNNNEFDFHFNKNFSKYGFMGEEASAFDYAFYAMELIAFFIIMCACIIAATSIAGEYTAGTIKMIAVRPYKRNKIISSKFLATLVLTFLLLLLTSVIVIITGIINYGINLAPILAIFNGTAVFKISPILMFVIYFITILIKAVVFISIAMMFSVIFKNVTPAIIVSLLTFFVAPIFTSFVPLVPALTYLPLINIDLFKFFGNQFISSYASQNSFIQIFTSQNFLSSNIIITLVLVIISIAICLTTTYLLFKKRDI